MKKMIVLASLFTLHTAMASTTGFPPEEDITYSVSEPLPVYVPKVSVFEKRRIAAKKAATETLRFAPEEDITYSVSTDNIASIHECEKRK